MQRTKARRTVGLALGLAALLLVGDLTVALPGVPASVAGPATARAAIPSEPGECLAGWRQMPVPDSAFASFPFEVVSQAGRPAWIFGASARGMVALRWNGSAWRRVVMSSGRRDGLVGAAMTASGRVWAVGYRRTSGSGIEGMVPLSGRIDANRWRSRRVSQPPGTTATLSDVTAAGQARTWAVGTRIAGGRTYAYALLWSDGSWRRQEPSSGSGAGLQAVEVAPGGAVWAVGWKESTPGVARPFIVRRRAGRWVRVTTPPLPAGPAVLTDVRFRGGADGWAVGYHVARGAERHEVILLHWDGNAWSRVELPWAAEVAALPRTLALGSGEELWIAGTQTATDAREPRGFVAHRRDGAWQLSLLDTPDAVRSEVTAVAATDTGAVAVASVAGTMIILHSCDAVSPQIARARRVRVQVGAMRTRRRVAAEDDADAGTSSQDAERAASTAAAGVGQSVPAAVSPRGFRVRDMSAATGLAQWTRTYGGFAADFDGNRYLDVFIGRHGGPARLALNDGQVFGQVRPVAFSQLDRHGCASADVDRDGARDILCALGAARGKAIKRHELSLAPDKSSAALVRSVNGISDPLGRGRQVSFIRLDDDAFPDVFISNAPDREDGLPSPNRFYRNVAGRFVPAPDVGLDRSHGGSCTAVSDLDRDGDEDLAYCTMLGFDGRRAGLRLMRNERGVLRDRTTMLGVKPMGDRDVAFADVTGDGRHDLIQLSKHLLRVSRRTRSGYQRIYQVRVREGTAVAAGDASGDGRADIYVVQGGADPNLRDLLLVSRDHGRRFTSVTIPQTTKGSGDDVITLDWDRNGLADFVVLDGATAGPVRLLASFRG